MNYKIIIILIAVSTIIMFSIVFKSSQKNTQKENILITVSPTSSLPPSSYQTPTSQPQKIQKEAIEVSIDDLVRVGPDSDGDGIKNIIDNCPFLVNYDQKDTDQSGIGDDCEAIELAKQDLAKMLGSNASVLGIGIEAVVEKNWPDPCSLGTTPDQASIDNGAGCIQVITPGYQVTFEVSREGGKKYLYHTDKKRSFRFVGEVK